MHKADYTVRSATDRSGSLAGLLENLSQLLCRPFVRDMISKKTPVALARKLVIALWRFVTTGELPEGVVLRPAS